MTQVSEGVNPTIPAIFGQAGDGGAIAAAMLVRHCTNAQRLHDQAVLDLMAAGIREEVARDAARAFLPEAMRK